MKIKRSKSNKIIIKGLAIFILSIISWSCQQDNLELPQRSKTIQKFKSTVDLSIFNKKQFKNLNPLWYSFFEKNFYDSSNENDTYDINKKITYYEFNLDDNQKNSDEKVYYTLLIQKEFDKEHTYAILKISPNNKNKKQSSYLNIQNFSGTITWYNRHGENYRNEYYNNGKLEESFKITSDQKEIIPLKLGRCGPPPKYNRATTKQKKTLQSRCGAGGAGNWIKITTHHYNQNIYIWSNGSTGQVFGITFGSERYTGSTSRWVFVRSNDTYNNNTRTTTYINKNTGSEVHNKYIEQLINNNTVDKIYNNLTGKAKCVYDKLIKSSKSFKEMIKKFDGEFPVSHLKYTIDYNLPNLVNAITDNSAQYLIEIKLNGNNLEQRTILGLVRTLAHETIHAELFRKVKSVNGLISINDFPGIYDYYRRYLKNWQHQQMAAHYRKTISDILRTFDNNQHSNQFYDDLAWEGLHGTVIWNKLSYSERNRIINVIKEYKSTGNKNCN